MSSIEQEIQFPLKLPAIRVNQPIGEFYAVSINSRILQQVAFSSKAEYKRKDLVEGVFSLMSGNQRELDDNRSKEISVYIDSVEATFPNSVILGANLDRSGNFITDPAKRWNIRKDEKGNYELIVPTKEQVATIIDGQHRLSGFKYSERKSMVGFY